MSAVKNGVKLVSMTQELGDDPMHVMMQQIMALFDEYQSKENAKHTLRAPKENARQGKTGRKGRRRDRRPGPHAGAVDEIRLRRSPPHAWKGRRITFALMFQGGGEGGI